MVPILLAAVTITLLIGYQYTISANAISPSTVHRINKWGGIQHCDFVIFTDGTTYYSKNCDTGAISYSGTNAATVFQNTITSGLPSAGGEIVVKSGTYNISQQMNITKNRVTISGEGRYLTTLTATTAGITMFKSGSGNNIGLFTLQDMTLKGNDIAAGALYWNCASCLPGTESHLKVMNIQAYGYTGTIFQVFSSAINKFINVYAHSAARIILLSSTAHTWIEMGDLEGATGASAMKLEDTVETWISNTKFDLNTGTCIEVSFLDNDVFMDNVVLWQCGGHGLLVSADYEGRMLLNNIRIANPGNSAVNTYDGINVAGTGGTIMGTGISIRDSGSNMRYAINDAGSENVWVGGDISGGVTGKFNFAGTSIVVKGIGGLMTESKGTGSIANGATSAWVTHALNYTPVPGEMTVIFTENPTNTPGATFITNTNSTHFLVNVENDPGASNLDFSWAVRRVT